MTHDQLEQLTSRCVESGQGCTRGEAHNLLDCGEASLFASATDIREAYFGNTVRLCTIVNARSGSCDMNCAFCPQSAHHDGSGETFPLLSPETIHAAMEDARSWPAGNFSIVTSGGALPEADTDSLIQILKDRPDTPGPELCCSLGRLSPERLGQLVDAGVQRYHHNLETSEAFYPSICTTQDWSARRTTVEAAHAAGMSVCSGGLFGLGESWDDRIDLAFTLRELGVDSIPLNFFDPRPGTPLCDQAKLSPEESLRIIAIYRLICPTVTIRICGGRLSVLNERHAEIFAAGANAMMTGNYLTTSGREIADDLAMLESLGMEIV
jgi:biotin synthase